MCIKTKLQNYIKNIFDWSEFSVKKTAIFILISLLFFYPILYAHAIYADDLYRLKTGQFLWLADGRPLAYLIAKIYTLTHTYIIDPTPFNWIFAITVIGVSAKIIYIYFESKYKESSFLLASIFIINPFFIQNMLYRFDSIGMSLAILFCISSFCVKREFFILRILLLLICINFYQPASNLFLGLMAIEIVLMFHCKYHTKIIRQSIISNLVIFIFASVIYLFEKALFLHVTSGRTSILDISWSLPYNLLKNYIHAFEPFLSFWEINFIFILPALILMIISLFKIMFYDRNMRLIVGFIIALLFIIISSLGGMVLLKYQLDFFQVRVYMYFPIVVMFIYLITKYSFSNLAKMVLIPILFVCFIFSARVGNIQQLQTEFEKPIFYGLTVDIYSIENKYKIEKFYSLGQVPYSAFVSNELSSTPFYGYMTRYEGDTKTRLLEYGNNKVSLKFQDSPESQRAIFDKKKHELLLVVDKPYYDLYIDKKSHEGWVIWKTVWLV